MTSRPIAVGHRGLYITLANGVFYYASKPSDAAGELPRATTREGSLLEIETRLNRTRWFRPYWYVTAPLLALAGCGGNAAGFLFFLALIAAGGFAVYRWDRSRRAIFLHYDAPAGELDLRLSHLDAVGRWLSSSHAIWHMYGGASTLDQKRNAGASSLVKRERGSVGTKLPEAFRCNVDPWVIQQGMRQLVLLPDRLLVVDGKKAFSVAYEHLIVKASASRFIEEERPPSDAQQVDTTWRFVNRDGGPDLRFNNNVQLPVMSYGSLELGSPSGPFCSLLLSSRGAADNAAGALSALSRLADAALRPYVPVIAVQPSAPVPMYVSAPPQPPQNELPRLDPVKPLPPPAPLPTVPASPASGRLFSPAPPPVSRPPLPNLAPSRPAPAHSTEPVPLVPALVANAVSAPSPGYRLPTPPTRKETIAQHWVPWNSNVQVGGLSIGGGLYVGSGLSSVNQSEIEPALIDPRLRVDVSQDDVSTRRLDYWPSYSGAPPAARGAYLNWLASGRSDPTADTGYVFLYFYGLERRALADLDSESEPGELPALVAEVQRLLAIYGGSSSFRAYASSLLNVLGARVLPDRAYAKVAPPLLVERELSFNHRLALAQVARDGAPLPADWAFTWLMGSPDSYLRTPGTRCPTEFRRLFIQLYCEKFGEGMKITPNKSRLKVEHNPASRTFAQRSFQIDLGLADVSVLVGPVKRFQEIANACCDQLDSYSRAIGKAPEMVGTFDAVIELPPVVWPDAHRAAIERVRTEVASAAAPTAMSVASLKARFPGWTLHSKQKMERFGEVLDDLGLGIEPDVRLGGGTPSEDGAIALFLENPKKRQISAAYQTVLVVLQLGAAVANADGVVTPEERQALHHRVETWPGLSPNERQRLTARAELLLLDPPKLSGLKKQLAVVSQGDRRAIGDFLAAVAQADSRIDPVEMKMLEKIFGLLGLDAGDLYSRAHAASIVSGAPSAPVTSTAKVQKPNGFNLDPAKIKALQADTERVSGLLNAIFTEEEASPVPSPEPSADEPVDDATPSLLPGLDALHSTFARILLTRASWSRAELVELSTDREMLLDGALERINEAAFDHYSFAFCEGDDPIEVTQDIMKELQHGSNQTA